MNAIRPVNIQYSIVRPENKPHLCRKPETLNKQTKELADLSH